MVRAARNVVLTTNTEGMTTMGYTMDQLDDIDALRARDAQRNLNRATADDMRSAALNRMREQRPATRTTERLAETAAASTKQIGLVMILLRKLADHNPVIEATARAWWVKSAIFEDGGTGRIIGTHLNRDQVSDVINRLRAHLDAPASSVRPVVGPPAPVATPEPVKARTFDSYDDITDGNYALVDPDGKNRFYRITRKGGKGQYAGRTFINIQERASEELFPVRGAWARRAAILDRIRTAGVEASHLLYAQLLKRCWHCHTELTDNTQPYHRFGLGPYCGPKVMG